MVENDNDKAAVDKARGTRQSALDYFERWLDADEPQRQEMLAALATQAPDTHARLLKLIAADRDADVAHFLDAGALSDAGIDEDELTLNDLTGRQFGAWRFERLLGVGGAGQVWLARRCDGLHGGVAAIKLLRIAELDGYAQQRFAREGRVLAELEHPHIARLIDVGKSSDGQRYLVLEYIDGERIDRWCDRHGIDINARLNLFLQVCEAVAYAHARLIVHRDLKPSNILVQEDGEVKLLDFGVAKLLGGDVAEGETAELTHAAGAAFTPEYASPEQFEGKSVTVTTDVYSLGVVLYLLLSGRRPYADEVSTPAQFARAIVDGEPRRLSSISGSGEDTRRIAAQRGMSVEQLRRQLRGDLDTILGAALKKDPTERYASVQAFAGDVRRYLGHRPIRARGDSRRYRLGKFLRRHWAGVTATMLLVLAILGGLVGTIWEAHRANLAAQRAERSREFLASLIQDVNPFSLGRGNVNNPAGALDNALKRIERDLADEPDEQIELRHDIETVLLQRGEYARGRDIGIVNIAALRRLHDGSPQLGAALSEFGIANSNLGDAAAARKAFAEAEPLLRDAGPGWAHERISLLTGIAKLDNQEGDHVAAHALHERILAERQTLDGEASADVAMDLMNLAADAFDVENYREAETLAKRSHAMLIRTAGEGHARRIYVDNMLGIAQLESGHAQEAIATLAPVVDMARAALGPDAVMTGMAMANLGAAQLRAGNAPLAMQSLGEARRILQIAKYPSRGRALLKLGLAEMEAGHAEAEQTLRDAVQLLAGSSSGNDGYAQWAQAAEGKARALYGDAAGGEAEARTARADLLAGKHAQSVRLGDIDVLLADILAQGSPNEAARLRTEAREVYRRVLGENHPKTLAIDATAAAASGLSAH